MTAWFDNETKRHLYKERPIACKGNIQCLEEQLYLCSCQGTKQGFYRIWKRHPQVAKGELGVCQRNVWKRACGLAAQSLFLQPTAMASSRVLLEHVEPQPFPDLWMTHVHSQVWETLAYHRPGSTPESAWQSYLSRENKPKDCRSNERLVWAIIAWGLQLRQCHCFISSILCPS